MNNTENNNLIKLVIDARDGADGAFEALYKETVKTAYSVASLLLKNEEDIEDALQNSYMYVAKSLKDLKNPESFDRWLRVIVKHECQKHIAKHKRASDIFAAIIKSEDFEIPVEDELPFDLVERKEISEKVRKIVDKLPEDKRACVVLYYFEQNTLPEIAEFLGVPEGTVKSRLYSARKTLEKEFEKLKKKDNTLFGVSLIPLLAAFFTYQTQNVVVPLAIAEGGLLLAAPMACGAVSAASAGATSVAGAGVATAAGSSAAGALGGAVAAKITAVTVAAVVATGGSVATVNYIKDKNESESTALQVTVTEEYTTAMFVTEETTAFVSEPSTADITTELSKTTARVTTARYTAAPTTKRSTTAAQTTAKPSTTKAETTTLPVTTQRETTTDVPVTDAADAYKVSGGVLGEYTGAGGNVVVPSAVGGETVSAIGTGAFSGNTAVRSVSLPSSVTRIGQEAFADCTSLASVSLPSSLQSIGIGAFWGCTELENINVPSGVTQIGDDAFADCSALRSIVIPSEVTSIGDNAFGGCDNLVIKCAEDSAAHNYAVENSIEFEIV